MTTLFVLGFAMMAMLVVTGLTLAWTLVRAVLWLLFLPLLLIKAVFGLVFGLVFGAFGLILGLLVTLVIGGVGLLAVLAVLAIPAIPLLLLGALVWLAVKGTTALAAA